ncbi:MAG: putative toxin-antitoxin system toxin component, PIN family [Bacteroidetes bacterium]|jgi:putative PIN family toxin of toxin-antitoxin system|nr:putative toxin-antitoxin system toxin component, PIN family [Bacteroidota bacterium]
MKPPQVVLDTNVVYTALRSRRGASFQLLSLLGTEAFDINLSVPLLLEYEEVLLRERRALGLSPEDVDVVLDYLCAVARLHEIFFLWRPHLADPADEMVLDLAVRAECQHIVTYIKRDFQGVERFGVSTVTAKELLELLGALP